MFLKEDVSSFCRLRHNRKLIRFPTVNGLNGLLFCYLCTVGETELALPHSTELLEKVKNLPSSPGVYLMKDSAGKIIYVGKSKSLRHRVPNYFQAPEKLNIKTLKLSEKIADFDTIITANETEALILENELIKRHMPRYNILLKDSKTYPYIKVSYESSYPKISYTRKRKNDKAVYFGPYTSGNAASENIKTIQKIFKIASCGKDFENGKQVCRPCLNSHIGRCCAPCNGKLSAEEYTEIFKNIESFLKGESEKLISDMQAQMLTLADNLMFEAAARQRDSITALKLLSEKQKIISSPERECDIFGIYNDESQSCLAILFLRGGKIIDKEQIFFSKDELNDDYVLMDLLERYYAKKEVIPKSIYVSFDIGEDGEERISETLSAISGHKVVLHRPIRGENKSLCILAVTNAREAAAQRAKAFSKGEDMLIKIMRLLCLESLPTRIEAYDISNNGEKDIYCGMIVLENGKFKKSDYRSFSIKSVTASPDDYMSMKEALSRRFAYLKDSEKENSSFESFPDLILLDGGKGHVKLIRELCDELSLPIAVFGMVKDDFHKTRTLTDGENEISIAKDAAIFSFFYKIQEEVHRFTFSKMDTSRRKSVKTSSLESIEGIGKAKAKLLLSHFKSISKIKSASIEELTEVKGISLPLAKNIINHFKKDI